MMNNIYLNFCITAKGWDTNCKLIPGLDTDYTNAPDTCEVWELDCCDKDCALAKKNTAQGLCDSDKQSCMYL